MRAGVGFVVLMYGGHFKTTAVVCASLEDIGLEQLELELRQVWLEYRRVRAQLEEVTGGELAIGVSPNGVEADTARLGAATLSADARPFLTGLQRLQSSVVAQVAMALNQNTMRIGLGLRLGRRLADAIGAGVERLLIGDEEIPEDQRSRVRFLVDMACTTSGVAIAWRLRGWAALWTSCGLGSELCLEALDAGLGVRFAERHAMLLGTSVAAFGFLYQAQHWGEPPLPWALSVTLMPVRAFELGLASIA